VTIFDLIPLVMEDHFKKAWPPKVFARYRKKLARLETDYDLFLHISQHTCADFTARLAVHQKSHVVTPLAVADCFRPYPFPKIAEAEDYVLYPGGFDPRKNMIGALEAFAELHKQHGNDTAVSGTRLRIVCYADETSEKDLRKRARRLGIDDKLDLTGFVTDAELVGLYQKARCLFFPSLYEASGFRCLKASPVGCQSQLRTRLQFPRWPATWRCTLIHMTSAIWRTCFILRCERRAIRVHDCPDPNMRAASRGRGQLSLRLKRGSKGKG